jgi:HAD superfamily hydrolase (TIGR01549 family)
MDNLNLENFSGIIFDLDGVIYDITEAINKAVEDAIEKYNLNVNKDEIMQEIAHLIEEIQNYPVPQIILNSYNLLKEVNALKGLKYFKKMRIAVFLFNQFNKYREEAKIFEGIDEIISKLSKKVKLAILTNNKSTYAEEVLEKFNLTEYFETIIGFNEVTEVKPSPEGILKILDRWNLKPSETIFIGDMTTDIIAGKAANVKMICVASGLAQKETLMEQEPDILLDTVQDLNNLFNL